MQLFCLFTCLGGNSGACTEVRCMIICLHVSTSPGENVLRRMQGHRRGTELCREIRGTTKTEFHSRLWLGTIPRPDWNKRFGLKKAVFDRRVFFSLWNGRVVFEIGMYFLRKPSTCPVFGVGVTLHDKPATPKQAVPNKWRFR